MVLKHFMMTVALLVLVAGVATANCGSCASDAVDTAVAADTGCGGAAKGITAQATQDGYTFTYALNNGSLEKRKGCGMVVKSVKLDCPMVDGQGGAQGCGARSAAAPAGCGARSAAAPADCGARAAAAASAGCGSRAAAAPAGCGSRSAEGSGCGGAAGCGMRGGEGHGPKLTADADGVYLACRGKVFAWDLDLNPTGTQDMRDMKCSDDAWQKVAAEERALVDGAASLKVCPMCPMGRKLPLRLVVSDAAGNADGDATVSAFLYPKDQPEDGSGVELLGTDAGEFQGLVTLAEAGAWELAVRVVRPGAADEIVYYMFDAQ